MASEQEDVLQSLSDLASEAHNRIQQAYEHINPVIEVRQAMRKGGIPADVMTIDCLRTRRRIVLILHDEEPGMLLFEFIGLDEDAGGPFRRIPLTEVSADTLFDWMKDYFWN